MIKSLQTSFLKEALLTSTVPLFIKAPSFLLTTLEDAFFTQNVRGEHNFIPWINDGLDHLISAIYSNYLMFMAIMIALSLLISLLKMKFLQDQDQEMDLGSSHDFSPLKASSKVPHSIFAQRGSFKTYGKLIICFTLIFNVIQLTSIIITDSFFNQKDITSSSPLQLAGSIRNLEQIPSDEEEYPEVSMALSTINAGEILGYIPYEYPKEAGKIAFTASKDGKTLFAIKGSELSIVDISNPKIKRIIAVQDIKGLKGFLWASMVVSPDTKFIYFFSNRNFAIIEISSQAAPILRFLETKSFEERSFSSLALSPDGKILYSLLDGDINFYNVSKSSSPEKLYGSSLYSKGFFSELGPIESTRIAVSKDGTKIAIAFQPCFKIFDVVNIRKPFEIYAQYNMNNIFQVFSVAFSEDQNKLLLGVLENKEDVSIQILDISNQKSSSFVTAVKLDGYPRPEYKKEFTSMWFHPNFPFAFFFTRNELRIVSIAEKEQTALLSYPSDFEYKHFAISADGTRCFVYFADKIIIIKPSIGLAPKAFSEFTPNTLRVIDEPSLDKKLVLGLSSDGKNLFFLDAVDSYNQDYRLMPYQRLSSNISLVKLYQPNFTNPNYYPFLKNAKWDIIAGKNIIVVNYLPNDDSEYSSSISVMSAVDKNKTSILTQFQDSSFNKMKIPAFAIPEDERFLAFVVDRFSDGQSLTLNIIPLTGKIPSRQPPGFELPSDRNSNRPSSLKTNKNGTLIFYSDRNLLIYNISDVKSPVLQSSRSLEVSKTIGLALSKNERTLYHFGLDSEKKKKLQIFDISFSLESPKLLSSSLIDQAFESTNLVELSPDGKILYLGFTNGMLMINVQTSSQPVPIGFNYYLGEQHALKFVPHEQFFYAISTSGVTFVDMTSQYILDLNNSNFKIGGSYSIRPDLLKLNKNLTFDFMIKKHKVVKVALLDGKISSNTDTSKALPGWINFDKDRSILVFDPKTVISKTADHYRMSAIVSTQIQASSFIGLEAIILEDDAQKLMRDLIQSGYLDNEGFISRELDFNKQLWIDTKYKNISKDIREILAQNYIRAIGKFSVSPSLNISFEGSHLAISTLSRGFLSVSIQLIAAKNGKIPPRFVDKPYLNIKPTVNENSLTMFGSLENINEVLKEIIINFDNEQPPYAKIHVSDGLNPSISRDIFSLEKYFIENKDPIYAEEKSLQIQLKNKQPFYTGQYSGIEFDHDTFRDENNLPLEYNLEVPYPKKEMPAWISLKGLALVATPPEKMWPLSHDFVLVVKNDFRKVSIPFKLDVKISFLFGVGYLLRWVSPFASLVGLYLSRNKFLNIINRKSRSYPRSFKLKVGEQITGKNLFPMTFVQEEIQQSKIIFKDLEKYGAQQKAKLLDYFIDPQLRILEKNKVISTLEILNNEYYNQADDFSREIIQQLILNKLVEKQLATKQETRTREIFHKIKQHWMDLVIITTTTAETATSLQFSINSDLLEQELSNISPFYQKEDSSSLLEKNTLNKDLLQNALLGHAFDFQNLDIDPVSICVTSYQKQKGRSLWLMIKRLLIRDLKLFASLGPRELGYGVKYKIEESIIHFSGQLTRGIKDNVMVIHLKDRRDKILREILITGEATKNPRNSYIELVSEPL